MTPTPPSTTSSNSGPQSPDDKYRVVRKRNRVPLSCGPCRHRKLKCNRAHPCDNCVKRGDGASCQYATSSNRRKTSSGNASGTPDEMQDRINRLESLVLSLMTSGQQDGSPATAAAALSASRSNTSAADGEDAREDGGEEDSEVEKMSRNMGVIKIANDRQFYASEAHWWAILSDIAEVKRYFSEHQKQFEEQVHKVKAQKMDDGGTPAATSLLFRGIDAPDEQELLSNFPPRVVADKLIFRYFNSENPANRILHGPTFRKEYEQHWLNPKGTSVVWLGLCYSLMSMALQSYHRAGDEPPEFRGQSAQLCATYSRWAAQCLVAADYTQPRTYMIEALCFYLQAEAARHSDLETGIWMLHGLIMRLAIRMGLHRDSKPYASITPFQGEMRRRVWSVIRAMDIFLSFQVGLPNMVKSSDTDTALPANIYDEEFDQGTKVIPRSRPSSENTPMSFHISITQMAYVLGKILELTQALQFPAYEAAMKLDAELRRVYDEIPQLLRLQSKAESENDPANLVMQRYTLDLLYQKSQCILHRKFLTAARRNLRFAYSRRSCIDACIQMLGHQSTLYQETQPGGRLCSITWSANLSLTTHDFLLAAMIICLDLYHTAQAEARGETSGEMYKWAIERREDMIGAIERAATIWEGMRDRSLEALKASTILRVMLDKLRNHDVLRQQLQSNFSFARGASNGTAPDGHVAPEHSAAMTLGMMSSGGMTPDAMSLFDRGYLPPRTGLTPQPLGGDQANIGMPMDAGSPFSNFFGGTFGLAGMGDMQPSNLDWDAWDTMIQGTNGLDPSLAGMPTGANLFDSPYMNGQYDSGVTSESPSAPAAGAGIGKVEPGAPGGGNGQMSMPWPSGLDAMGRRTA